MKKNIFLLLILAAFIHKSAVPQSLRPTNIIYRTIGDKIEIFYDLPRNSDTLDVTIYFRKKSDPKTKYRLKWVRGSIGIGKFSGMKQKVIWRYKKEPSYLFTGSGFYYEIIPKKIKLKRFKRKPDLLL